MSWPSDSGGYSKGIICGSTLFYNNNNNNNNNNTFIYIALFLFLTNSALQDIYNLTSHRIINKGCETGPPVYRPYPRRLESLTICRCNYKGSTFSSVI